MPVRNPNRTELNLRGKYQRVAQNANEGPGIHVHLEIKSSMLILLFIFSIACGGIGFAMGRFGDAKNV